jgi:integrase/recombinase XerD
MQRTGLRLLISRIGLRAGVPDAGVHRFRHTFAVNFLRNGGNLLALQDLLGHKRLDTVRIYAKQAEVDLERQQKGASPADRWRL